MRTPRNPFEYEQATTLSPDFVKDVFIEDHNFTRFIQSNRNIFLVGERGSGKSMTLLYNSIGVQRLRPEYSPKDINRQFIGVYVPCNTPLTHKKEYELFSDDLLAAVSSEHFFVLGIAFAIANDITQLTDEIAIQDDLSLREELTYVLGADLPPEHSALRAFMMFIQRESRRSQQALNALDIEGFRQIAFTFSSLVIPLLHAVQRLPHLRNTHFLLLIDDAHDLNHYQKATLNSWLSFRDRSHFSFKIAVADIISYDYRTSSNGSILEGHDFLTVDLQQPFQSPTSDFGRLARDIVEKRLSTIGADVKADAFFPISADFERHLERFREDTLAEAEAKYSGVTDQKKRRDHVYKYARVKYFRERASKANLPSYSGFDTIAHVSTGVIRNLLKPCYWMYDAVCSQLNEDARDQPVSAIPPEVQSSVIQNQSESLWKWIEISLSSSIDNCTLEDGTRVYQLFDNLGELFRRRLLAAKSEPRALAFSISGMTPEYEQGIMRLLNVARRAQLLYLRSGPAKDEGRRETYYVPNRMLWPIRGLDVVGQHARVSLKARDLWAAANGVPFPFPDDDERQQELFDEEK